MLRFTHRFFTRLVVLGWLLLTITVCQGQGQNHLLLLLALQPSGQGGPAHSPAQPPASAGQTPAASGTAPVVIEGPAEPPAAVDSSTFQWLENQLVYDVNFELPEHKAGEVVPQGYPLFGAPPSCAPNCDLPRRILSRAQPYYGGESLRVRAAASEFQHSQHIQIPGPAGVQPQVSFYDLPAATRYCADMVVRPMNGSHGPMVRIFWDAPVVHAIQFMNGIISVYDWSTGEIVRTQVGTYPPGHIIQLRTSIDLERKRWRVFFNQVDAYEGPMAPGSGRLQSFRFTESTPMGAENRLFIDNVRVRANCYYEDNREAVVRDGKILYDLEFEPPEHVVDQPPVTGAGDAPRRTVTTNISGQPWIVGPSYGLSTQHLTLSRSNQKNALLTDQVRLDIEAFPQSDSYCVSGDMVINGQDPISKFNIVLDGPQPTTVSFKGGVVSAGAQNRMREISTYGSGQKIWFLIAADLKRREWIVRLNDVTHGLGPLSLERLNAVRFSNDAGDVRVDLDNIIVRRDCLRNDQPTPGDGSSGGTPPGGGEPGTPPPGGGNGDGGGSGTPPPEPADPPLDEVVDGGPQESCPGRTIELDPSEGRWFQTPKSAVAPKAGNPDKVVGLHTFWANEKLKLRVRNNCQAGTYNLRIRARNVFGPLPDFYDKFQVGVLSQATGEQLGSVLVKAADAKYHSAGMKISLPKGDSDLILAWNNDAYKEGVYDANIHISNISLGYVRQRVRSARVQRTAPEQCFTNGRWFFDAKSAWTYWKDQEIGFCYENLPAGRYKLVVRAKNYGVLPPGYKSFQLLATADGVVQELTVPANEKKYQNGSTILDLRGGDVRVDLKWLNDEYHPGVSDANIRIRGVSLQRIGDGERAPLAAFVWAARSRLPLWIGGIAVLMALMLLWASRRKRLRA